MGLYLAFYTGRGDSTDPWRDRIIRWATNSDYSHVELILDDTLAAENECIAASKRDGNCVRRKRMEWKADHWHFYEIPCAPEYARKVRHYATKYEGEGYDTIGALLTVFGGFWHSKEKWFCSELIANALGFPHDPHRYTPGSLCAYITINLGAKRCQVSLS